MAKIPRGIQAVQWHNGDRSKSERYRVRIQRKDLKVDKLFETLDEAKKFLADSRSDAGRQAITDKLGKLARLKELLKAPPLSHYLDLWAKDRLPTEEEAAALPEQKRKARKGSLSRIEVIKRTMVEWSPGANHPTGAVAPFIAHLSKKPFGNFGIADIDPAAASAYINARLAGGAGAATVKRDVSFLSSFFGDWLADHDPKAVERHGNPFATAKAKKKLKGADKARDTRLHDFGADAETRLVDALRACRNPHMAAIVGLGLTTGMRRGEILGLTWDRVLEKHIELQEIDTKSGKPRRIPISAEAEKIFQSLGRKDGPERLFSYTADGFKSVWDRVRRRAGMPTFRFHDVRHEYVSKVLEVISSPVAAAAVAGYSSVHHLERQHLQPLKNRREIENGVQSEKGLMLAVGHSDSRMTAVYASKIAGKVSAAVDAAREAERAGTDVVAYPVVIETGDDGVGVFAPDLGVFLACGSEEEALVKITEAIIASPERPAPSSPMKIARENQGAVVRTVKIPMGALVAADEARTLAEAVETLPEGPATRINYF